MSGPSRALIDLQVKLCIAVGMSTAMLSCGRGKDPSEDTVAYDWSVGEVGYIEPTPPIGKAVFQVRVESDPPGVGPCVATWSYLARYPSDCDTCDFSFETRKDDSASSDRTCPGSSYIGGVGSLYLRVGLDTTSLDTPYIMMANGAHWNAVFPAVETDAGADFYQYEQRYWDTDTGQFAIAEVWYGYVHMY